MNACMYAVNLEQSGKLDIIEGMFYNGRSDFKINLIYSSCHLCIYSFHWINVVILMCDIDSKTTKILKI